MVFILGSNVENVISNASLFDLNVSSLVKERFLISNGFLWQPVCESRHFFLAYNGVFL